MKGLLRPHKTDLVGPLIGQLVRGITYHNSEATFDRGEQRDRLISGTSCGVKVHNPLAVVAGVVEAQVLTQVVFGDHSEILETSPAETGTSPVESMRTSLIPVVSLRLIKVTSGREHWLEQTHMIPVHVLAPASKVDGVVVQAHPIWQSERLLPI